MNHLHVIPVDASLTPDEAWLEICIFGKRITDTGKETWVNVECDGEECSGIEEESIRREAVPSGPVPIAAGGRSGNKTYCEDHWAQVRLALDESGLLMASLVMMEKAASSSRFTDLAKEHLLPGETPAAMELNIAMRKAGPLCCFLGEQARQEVLEETRKRLSG